MINLQFKIEAKYKMEYQNIKTLNNMWNNGEYGGPLLQLPGKNAAQMNYVLSVIGTE